VALLTEKPGLPAGELFIGGRWEAAVGGATQPVLDPSTGATVSTAAVGGAADVDRAVRAARAAFDGGGWARLRPRERGRILQRAADLLRGRAEEFARLESLDVGKPILFTRTVDIPAVVDTFEYYAGLTAGLEGSVRPTAAPALAYTRREPIGVVGAITPFNFPLVLSATKIAPALAAGNTIVHKPAPDTPLSALRFAELLAEAGVPDGVYNLVTGDSATGVALTGHPMVDKIAFTGSSAAGRAVAGLAARTLKQVTVELGGKGANIIFADADLEAAVSTAISAFVFNTGQFCMSGSRLLVERPVYESVIGALAAALPGLPVGDPMAEGTIIGPLAGPSHLARVRSYLDRAAAAGVRRHDGGDPPGPDGFYVGPALLADVDQASPFVQEEIFGPLVTVQPFDTEAEAVALANGTAYGLSAGLQTGRIARAHRVAAALNAGIVWVNGWSLLDPAMPFGGVGQSGYGRENGPEGLDAYLRTKSVLVSLAGA
jgi:acyl-CoA reductase-like NAD-dependent aldehyde dehydrogenase